MSTPNPERLRMVIFYGVNGPLLSTRIPESAAQELTAQLGSTWRGEEAYAITINDPSGTAHLINPAHVATVEIR